MITLTILLGLLFFGTMLYLGLGALWLAAVLVFKAIGFGLLVLFGLGRGIVLAAALALLVLFHLFGGLLLLVPLVAVLLVAWGLVRLLGGGRRPASSYAYSPREPWRAGGSVREATMERLRRALDRMELRTADLESELHRRGRY